ncbi:hypothetical protein ZWY2020_006427 [Hordeum vulgare]|nr:hypothetical protein ZWY2020_006427 [Hordeum vulgare]
MPTPGGYALVLDPTFVSQRVLVDGGSSINILYHDAMQKLGILESELEPTRTVFHDIIPDLSCSPIGMVRLDKLFGTAKNFHREPIWFEVVDLSSSYQAILGRTALAKFMAVPSRATTRMEATHPHPREEKLPFAAQLDLAATAV